MKKIIITNEEKIKKAIAEVEGKATARTTDYEDIMQVISKVENKLTLTKKDLDGIRVVYSPNEKLPRAYKWAAQGTQVELENTKGKWYITEISRQDISNTWNCINILMSDEKKKLVAEKLLEKTLNF